MFLRRVGLALEKVRAGEVVVVTFGPKETEQTLRAALATGADKAFRVDATDDKLDGDLVARVLKTLVERERPDVVLMGKQAVDGDTNQVGQILAELLDWPMATFAATIKDDGFASTVPPRSGSYAQRSVRHTAEFDTRKPGGMLGGDDAGASREIASGDQTGAYP